MCVILVLMYTEYPRVVNEFPIIVKIEDDPDFNMILFRGKDWMIDMIWWPDDTNTLVVFLSLLYIILDIFIVN